jgi:hypothetical protein
MVTGPPPQVTPLCVTHASHVLRYFEGAVVPEVCLHWEWCNVESTDDLISCRELLKTEFNG